MEGILAYLTLEHQKQIKAGKANRVVSDLEEALIENPENCHIRHDLAQCYHTHLGQPEKAVTIYLDLLKELPKHPQVLVNLGYAYLDLQEYDKALNYLNSVLETARVKQLDSLLLSLAHSNIATVHKERCHYDGALHHFLIARNLDNRNYLAERGVSFLKEYGSSNRGLFQGKKWPDGQTTVVVWTYPGVNAVHGHISQEVLLTASIVTLGDKTAEGHLIQSVSVAWFEIIKAIERDPCFLFRVPWYKLEELIAGAYEREGWPEVVLTPRSHDKGRDIIATKPGMGSIRIYDQIKAFAPNRKVGPNDVRALVGALQVNPNVSKGIVTTTSEFAPSIYTEMEHLIPYRLELKNGVQLKQWLLKLLRIEPTSGDQGYKLLNDIKQ